MHSHPARDKAPLWTFKYRPPSFLECWEWAQQAADGRWTSKDEVFSHSESNRMGRWREYYSPHAKPSAAEIESLFAFLFKLCASFVHCVWNSLIYKLMRGMGIQKTRTKRLISSQRLLDNCAHAFIIKCNSHWDSWILISNCFNHFRLLVIKSKISANFLPSWSRKLRQHFQMNRSGFFSFSWAFVEDWYQSEKSKEMVCGSPNTFFADSKKALTKGGRKVWWHRWIECCLRRTWQ